MAYKIDCEKCISCGACAAKVADKSQAGSALLKNPELIYEIVSSVKEAIEILKED